MIPSAPFEPEVRDRICCTVCANFGFGALVHETRYLAAWDARHLANNAIASSASTPPVIEIGAKEAFAAISASVSMI
jgi:hypothetical protein